MDQEQQATTETSNQGMSLGSKLANVFAAPGEVFESVKSTPPKHANWAVPVIITAVFGILFTLVVFSQPTVQSQMREQQEKRFMEQVQQGKMTREQADQAMQRMPAPGSTIWLVFGSAGVAVVQFVTLFFVALVMWLVGKFAFKKAVGYLKVLEAVGLSTLINALGTIITMLLIIVMGSFYATPSLALAISEYDPSNHLHSLASSVNIFTLWYLAVLSVGLGKIFEASTVKAALWVYILWAVWSIAWAFLGFGFR